MAGIKSIDDLLKSDLDIPDYQRPYKWTIQNNEGIKAQKEDAHILNT